MDMETVSRLNKKTLTLPNESGVYRMMNKSGDIIYIGKAKNLKNRVSSYFRSVDKHLPKVYKMVENVWDFDYIVTDSEFEALILECSLIKQYTPKYNILLKDDKGYHYIKITKEDYPRITAEFQKEDDNATYIGPYMSGMVVNETVDEVTRAFMLPTCQCRFPQDFRKHRPCLNFHIKRCMGVCTGKISKERYNEAISEALVFIKNGGVNALENLTEKMNVAAENLEFEKAARYRDRINAINRLNEKQKVLEFNHKSLDVIATVFTEEKLYIAILVFRDNRMCDKKVFILDCYNDASTVFTEFLMAYYKNIDNIPFEIFVENTFEDLDVIRTVLTQIADKKIMISVPKRGRGLELLQMAKNNVAQEISRRTNRTGKEIVACDELGKLLGIPAPMYIEAYDISNFGASTIVGGMVVFEKGRPQKKFYKKFTIKDQDIPDDYSAMSQVLTRRFMHYIDSEEKDMGFKTLPDLILVDGGAGHVSVAKQVIDNFGLKVAVFGMVKDNKHRTRAITAQNEEIAINTLKNVFTLVTNIQDEVHRYSIEFSRKSHSKNTLYSALLQIDGIGEKRATELFKKFKTYSAIKNATLEDLKSVKGLNESTAKNIMKYFNDEK